MNEERKNQLFEELKNNEGVRDYCGISSNNDGTYWVKDLDKVKAQTDETKEILREFLKAYGRNPEKYKIGKELRSELDKLYKKIMELSSEERFTYFRKE